MSRRIKIISFFLVLVGVLGFYAASTRPKTKVQANGNVVFTFNGLPPDAKVFNELDFKPGDCYTRPVSVQNNNDYDVPIAVKAEDIFNPDNLSSILSMFIKEADIGLYGGVGDEKTVAQFFTDSTAMLEGLGLSTVPANASTQYDFTVCMPHQAGNEWQKTTLVFDLVFGRTGPDITPTPTNTPTPKISVTPSLTPTPTLTLTPSITPTPTIPVPDECSILAGTFVNVIYGTPDNDNIHGSIYNDLIYGLGGDDYLDSSGGDDCVIAGDGNDTIDSEDGNDILVGGNGNDHLIAGSGNDMAYGNDGDDTIEAGSGNDTVYGGVGNDIITLGTGDDQAWGGDGDDIIDGSGGTDTIYGEAGNDTLTGGSSPDFLYGGDGDDYLAGESGDDHLDGGIGVDTLIGSTDTDYCVNGPTITSCELP